MNTPVETPPKAKPFNSFIIGESYSEALVIVEEDNISFNWKSSREHIFSLPISKGLEVTPVLAKLLYDSYTQGLYKGKDQGVKEFKGKLHEMLKP